MATPDSTCVHMFVVSNYIGSAIKQLLLNSFSCRIQLSYFSLWRSNKLWLLNFLSDYLAQAVLGGTTFGCSPTKDYNNPTVAPPLNYYMFDMCSPVWFPLFAPNDNANMLVFNKFNAYHVHHLRVSMLTLANYHWTQIATEADGNVFSFAGIWS